MDELKDRLRYALELRGKKAVDLVTDLKIPKSAISQYLSGKSQNMDSKRLYSISKYLDVSEPWLMGYDVPMERKKKDSLYTEDSAQLANELRHNSAATKLLIDFLSLDIERQKDVINFMEFCKAKK